MAPSPPPLDDWPDDPTPADAHQNTPTHDLRGVARVLSSRLDREGLISLTWSEAHEDAVRALYEVMRLARRPPLTRGEMDAIAMALRQRLTRL